VLVCNAATGVSVSGGAVVAGGSLVAVGCEATVVGMAVGGVQAAMRATITKRKMCFFMIFVLRFYCIFAGSFDDFGNWLVIEKSNTFYRTCGQNTCQSRAAQRRSSPARGCRVSPLPTKPLPGAPCR